VTRIQTVLPSETFGNRVWSVKSPDFTPTTGPHSGMTLAPHASAGVSRWTPKG